MEKDHFEKPYFFFLDSSGGGRQSIAAWDPVKTLISKPGEDFFETLREEIRKTEKGIWIGYFGYELYSETEKKVPAREPDLIPKGIFCWYDHTMKRTGPVPSENFLSPSRYALPGFAARSKKFSSGHPFVSSNFPRPEYLKSIKTIKDYITAGDCYQVNLSQRFTIPTEDEPYEIYQRLRTISPAPFSAFLNLGDAQILSSSPESFLELNGRKVTTRPIKGTRPRSGDPATDVGLKEELSLSTKDRAELLMITDLERNDLGRVCKPGSIRVSELQRIESYAQVHHLVSTIEGELAEGKDVIDLLKATFPGGSITGAPKIRAMEIIRELEPDPRNVYCGAIGYIDPKEGKAQFNVAIRTMILKNKTAYFWAGGGIVADSDPEKEYEETLVKAKGMREALTN